MRDVRLTFLAVFLALAGGALAQTAQMSDAAKAMVGTWEISNADRDKVCTGTFGLETVPRGLKLDFDKACGDAFPLTKDVAAWTIGADGLHLLDARGKSVLDLDEVETRIFEGVRSGEGRYFMQSLASTRAEPSPEQVFGDWGVSRGSDTPICVVTLSNTAAAANFALEVKPGCDAYVTSFNPTSWRLEGRELLLVSDRGDWRFQEAGQVAWQRVPQGTEPLWLVRQ